MNRLLWGISLVPTNGFEHPLDKNCLAIKQQWYILLNL